MSKDFDQKKKKDSTADYSKDVSTQTNMTGEHPKTSLRYEADLYINELNRTICRSFETDRERLRRHFIQFENSL